MSEMVVTTQITYKYLMGKSKHDLAHMVMDYADREEKLKNKVVCAYCGKEMSGVDKMEVVNHIATCEKRPEPNLLAKAFEIEDRLYAWLKHVTGVADDSVEHYWPTQCDTCKEIKNALDLYDEVEK